MNKLKPFFAAATKGDTLELSVYEDIGADWFGDGITAKSVKAQIDAAGGFSRIAMRINSPGGDAFEGIAIFNLLRAQKKPIDVFVDGIAASAASIIAMAGDTITVGPNAMIMVHNAWTVCMGEAKDMRAQADVLDRVSGAIAQTYVHRTGLSAADVKSLMDAESWLGAEECVEKGFATAIAESEDANAMALASSFARLEKLRNVPDQLRNKRPDVAPEPAAAAEPPARTQVSEPENDLSIFEAQIELLKRR